MRILVPDSHALIWYLTDDTRLGEAAGAEMDRVGNSFVIPTIVLAEIRRLCSKGRITEDAHVGVRRLRHARNCRVHPFDEHVLDRMPDALEIHDAIIVGTALALQDTGADEVALITNDRQITESGLVQVIW